MQEARSETTSSDAPVRHPSDTPETVWKPKLLDRLLKSLRSRHTFPYPFATHRLEDGYDIRTVQKLLFHEDVKTTMIYTHVLNRGGKGVRSPMGPLWRGMAQGAYAETI